MINRFLYNRLPQRENICNICFSTDVEWKRLTYQHEVKLPSYVKKKSMNFAICKACGYSFCGENFKDYLQLGASSISSAKNYKRVGDGVNPGREFFMTTGAIEILQKADFFLPQEIGVARQKKKLRVLIFAPGNSMDYQLLQTLDTVSECKITDLVNFQKSEHFVPIDTKEVFDVVIACEVVEHFMNPRKEFSNLFRYLDKDGLLVLSTDIRQDDDFSERIYPFLYGHTSYYSGKSLIFLAQTNGLLVDFRTPRGQTFKSQYKKYVYMTKSEETYMNVANRFSIRTYPVAE